MIVLIDNYDSFTHNIAHFLYDIGIHSDALRIVRNDVVTVEDILQLQPQRIILSPGPCSPRESGVCRDVVAVLSRVTPILGICLGHQVIGEIFGGRVIRAPQPIHGKLTSITHDGQGVFRGLKQAFQATRYHSLLVDSETLPECLEISARNEEGIIMGLRHKIYQHVEGVQFHPESLFTEDGHSIFRNFLRLEQVYEVAHLS